MDLCNSRLNLVENDFLKVSEFEYDNEGCSSGYDSATEQSNFDKESDTPISEASIDEDPTAESEVMKYRSTQELCNSLQYIISLPDLCDVKFLVGDKRVPVYGVKAILATRSRMFYNLILEAQRQSPVSKKSKKKSGKNKTLSNHVAIEINNYQPADFKELINFVHCGKVNIRNSNVAGLYCGASEFHLPELKIACRDFTKRSMRNGNTAVILKSTKIYLDRHRAGKTFMEKIRGYQKSMNG